MATLLSIQTGNFSDASTWALVDSTSFLETRTAEQSLSTTQTNSSVAFTPGAITISGIALQVATRVSAPTSTMTVRLWNNTTGAVVKDVVINVADLPNTFGTANGSGIGWTYFKFDTNVTLIAGNQYVVRAFTSVSSQVNIYRNATLNNWNRALVTTTTQAPAATDVLITCGVYTSAGVNSSVTVTMDSTSLATQYGNCYVGSNGILSYGVASSTNYGLRLAGDLWIGRGGTFTIGTAANPIHQTSTAVLEINCTTPLQYQIIQFGTFETKHATTVTHRALLNEDITVGATTMTTGVSTGWKQNDVIVIPSTTRTTTQHERVTLNADASGTSLTHNATTFAHDGNASIYIQADLANLTRSIKIRSVSSTNRTRFRQGLNGISNIFDVEFFEMGSNTHISGTGTYAGTFNLQQCSFWQIASPGATAIFSYTRTTTSTISNNVFYNYGSIDGMIINNNNLIIGFGAFTAVGQIGGFGSNNVVSSCSQAGLDSFPDDGSTGNRFYATGGNGAIYMVTAHGARTFSNFSFFNNGQALRFVGNTNMTGADRTSFVKFENCYFYGNVTTFDSLNGGGTRRFQFNNCFFWGGKTGLVTNIGYTPLVNDYTHFDSCTFGRMPNGVNNVFTTSCIRGGQVGTTLTNCLFFGTQFSYASTNVLTSINGFNGITSLKHNGITNEYIQAQSNGFIQNDNIWTYNGLPSIRITPIVATNKTFSNPVRVAVKSGQTCNVSVDVRVSKGSDGSIYNGNLPRLMYAFNPLAGNLTETVGASTTASNNLLNYAQTFENAYWTQSGMLVWANATIAPSGLLDGDKLSPTAVSSEHNVSPAVSPTLGNTETYSVYAKSAGYNFLGLRVQISGVWSITYFNLSTGAVSSSSANFISSNITSAGNGWYRCSITYANRSASGFQIVPAPSQTIVHTGNGIDGIFVWGAKLEVGTLTDYTQDGIWETLSYTTPAVNHDCVLEFYIDCDGTAGWINIDDFKTTTSNDTRGMNYWSSTGFYAEPDWRKPGGTVTFVN